MATGKELSKNRGIKVSKSQFLRGLVTSFKTWQEAQDIIYLAKLWAFGTKCLSSVNVLFVNEYVDIFGKLEVECYLKK